MDKLDSNWIVQRFNKSQILILDSDTVLIYVAYEVCCIVNYVNQWYVLQNQIDP